VIRPETPWKILRHGAMLKTSTQWSGEIQYYAVGRSSTVLLVERPDGLRLTTNGLPESLIPRGGPSPTDDEPARWLGMLPALLRPGLRDMLVIGLGGGLTVESVPASVQRVTVIELEEEVLRTHEWLASRRDSSPLRDPRVRVVVNDARGALQLTDARFGAIVSQPSHPWTAGASHLYTREFFSLVARHLEPGGVFVQWIGLAFVDEGLLRSLVATLLEVFPHVSLFVPLPGAVLFAASDTPLDPLATAGTGLAAAPADFSRFGLRVPEDVAASWALGTADARDFADGAPALTDDDNPLATRSARLGRTASARADELFSKYEPVGFGGPGLDPLYLIAHMASQGNLERALRIAESAPEGAQRFTAVGWARHVAAPQRAAASFRRAVAADPRAQSARFGLLRLMRSRVERGDPKALELAGPLEGAAAAVVKGWGYAARGQWAELRALEPDLAGADPRDPSRVDALRLRIRWRLAGSDPAVHAEASAIAVEMLRTSALPDDTLLAARAFARADRPGDALALIEHVSRSPRGESAQRGAIALLEELRPDVDEQAWAEVERRLTRKGRRGPAMPGVSGQKRSVRSMP
jgi:SAM-dependent methyltransferase